MRTATPVILDTNVVLDWLVFDHPAGLAVGRAIEGGEWSWQMCPRMADELIDVLGRLETEPSLQRWSDRREAATQAMHRWATPVHDPPALAPALPLRCSDPDDQVFIDLAVAQRVRWLFSRDRAILRLARRLALQGIETLTPDHWFDRCAASNA